MKNFESSQYFAFPYGLGLMKMGSDPDVDEKHSMIGHGGEDWGSNGFGGYSYGYNFSYAIT